MTDRKEYLPQEDPHDDAATGADDDRQEQDPPPHRTLYRVIGAVAVLVLVVVVALLLFVLIGMYSLECSYGSTYGTCSDGTQNLIWTLFFGGMAVGLVGTVTAAVRARKAPPGAWWLILTLAAAIPLVCMLVAAGIAAG